MLYSEIEERFTQWVDEFFSLPCDNSHTNLFKTLALNVDERLMMADDLYVNSFMRQMIVKRAEYIGLKIDEKPIAFLVLTCNPGKAIMYLYALRHWQFASVSGNTVDGKIQQEVISIDTMTSLFPNGFPTEESLSRAWDNQKLDCGNLLDLLDPKTCFGSIEGYENA
jgi:hypothetical protein